MNDPTCSQLAVYNNENCQVCGQKGHGNHFGAITCRACAAFFRRSIKSKNEKKCKKRNNCTFLKNEYFNCKKCRLERCRQVGMTEDKFQFDRDPFGRYPPNVILKKVPPTLNTFLGRSNLIIFVAPQDGEQVNNYIDVQFLLEKATRILAQGPATPFFTGNRLKKLAIGHQLVLGNKQRKVKEISRIGREDIFNGWEQEMVKVARWLTYFDEFQQLDHNLQVILLKSVWKVWTRLERVFEKTIGMKMNICSKDKAFLWNTEGEHLIGDLNKLDVDMSWCSKYTLEQIKFFVDENRERRLEKLIDMMMKLDPTEEELSYMLVQLCFHYAAKRYGGEIAQVAERFQESIANDLHDYYVNDQKTPKYLGRVASLMKVNNHIQEDIYQGRARSVVAEVFGIFCLEFSHPEMFVDF